MTPKEKAEEILKRFSSLYMYGTVYKKEEAKGYANIVIDEKIESITRDRELFSAAITQLKWGDDKKECIVNWFNQHLKELNEVKTEIENL